MDERSDAVYSPNRRRALLCERNADGCSESRPRDFILAQRRPTPGQTHDGVLVELRSGLRERGFAVLCGDDFREQGHQLRADILRFLLGKWFSSKPLPRCEISGQQRACVVFAKS